MSCFIVNPETVATIANYIADYITGGYNATGIFVSIPDEFIRNVTAKENIAQQIYLRMYALNYMAFETRYEGRHSESLAVCIDNMGKFEDHDKSIHKARTGKVEPYHYQLLKSMQCYLYQCNESEKLADSLTFKVVKKFEDALMNLIVCAMPEYDKAVWG